MRLRGACGCDEISAKRCSCSRALAGLAVSDPKARSALHIWKEGKSSNHNRGYPAPTKASSGHDLTSVDSSGRPSAVSFSIKFEALRSVPVPLAGAGRAPVYAQRRKRRRLRRLSTSCIEWSGRPRRLPKLHVPNEGSMSFEWLPARYADC